MDRIFALHADADGPSLQKAWVERRRWISENVARCTIRFSKEKPYELELQIDVTQPQVFSEIGLKLIRDNARSKLEVGSE